MTKKIIYDFGSNNGDDIPYYLLKADLVIAVEANPELCALIEKRFTQDISDGRLVVLNCVLTVSNHNTDVDFYIHKTNDVWSQFPQPSLAERDDFKKVHLPSRSATEIIEQYGSAYYVKIDIEHFDAQILRALFENDIRPPFISAESHSIEVFSLFVDSGNYSAFKLIDGNSIAEKYSDKFIQGHGKDVAYSFPRHSAGPFGNDIDGDWMTPDSFYRLLAFEGLGWKDIHATNIVEANPNLQINARDYYSHKIRKMIKRKLFAPLEYLNRK